MINNNNNNLMIKYNVNLFNPPVMKRLAEFSRLDIIQAVKSFGYQFHNLTFTITDATDEEFNNTVKVLETITYNYNKPLSYVLENFSRCCTAFMNYSYKGGLNKLDSFTESYFMDLIKTEKEEDKKRRLSAARYAKIQADRIKAELSAVLSRQNKKRISNLIKYQAIIDEALLNI